MPAQQEGGTFVLIAKKSEREKSLSQRVFSPTKFTNAFASFKEVILERFPHRSRELDVYLINIIDLATKYTVGHTGSITLNLPSRQPVFGPEASMWTGQL